MERWEAYFSQAVMDYVQRGKMRLRGSVEQGDGIGRCFSRRKCPRCRNMSEDSVEELRDELAAYKAQLDALREDLEIVVRYSTALRHSVISVASQGGTSGFNQTEVHLCQEFRDKYQIRIGEG
jgi:hypothetical protein